MKKSNQRLLKLSYEFVGQDSGEGRLERAFDLLFDTMFEAETKESNKKEPLMGKLELDNYV
jgi:hypothetical protein